MADSRIRVDVDAIAQLGRLSDQEFLRALGLELRKLRIPPQEVEAIIGIDLKVDEADVNSELAKVRARFKKISQSLLESIDPGTGRLLPRELTKRFAIRGADAVRIANQLGDNAGKLFQQVASNIDDVSKTFARDLPKHLNTPEAQKQLRQALNNTLNPAKIGLADRALVGRNLGEFRAYFDDNIKRIRSLRDRVLGEADPDSRRQLSTLLGPLGNVEAQLQDARKQIEKARREVLPTQSQLDAEGKRALKDKAAAETEALKNQIAAEKFRRAAVEQQIRDGSLHARAIEENRNKEIAAGQLHARAIEQNRNKEIAAGQLHARAMREDERRNRARLEREIRDGSLHARAIEENRNKEIAAGQLHARAMQQDNKRTAAALRQRERDEHRHIVALEENQRRNQELRRRAVLGAQLDRVDAGLIPEGDERQVRRGLQRTLRDLERLRDRLIRTGKDGTEEFRDLEAQIRRTNSAITTLRNQAGRAKGALGDLGRSVQQFFRYFIAYGILSEAVRAVGAFITSVVELDEKLHAIQAIGDATAAQMGNVAGAINRVALSTKFTTGQIADAAQVLTQAGVRPADLNRVLRNTALFASATGSTIEIAADLVSTARTVFKELSEETIANQLTRAINISKLTAEDLKVIFSIGAQIARSYNLSSEQFLAAVTTLRDAGLKASTVATGLRQGLIELFSPDKKTIGVLKTRYAQLGEELSEEAIQARFFSFTQADSPLTAALQELRRIGFNDAAAEQFGRVFDVRALNAIKALINNFEDLDKASSEITFGEAAVKASATQMESLANSVRNLGAAITVLGAQTFQGLIRSVEDFADTLTNSLVRLTKLDQKLRQTGGTNLSQVLGAAGVAAVSGVALGRGGLFGRLAQGAGAGAATLAGAAGGAQLQGAGGVAPGAIVGALTSLLLMFIPIGRHLGRINQAVRSAPDFARLATTAVSGATAGAGILSMFSRIGAGLARVPLLGRVAGFIAARGVLGLLGPIGWLVSLVGAVYSFGRTLQSTTPPDAAELKRRAEAGQALIRGQIADQQEVQAVDTAFGLSPDAVPKSGTFGSTLRTLEEQRLDVNRRIQNVIDEVGSKTDFGEVFDTLAKIGNDPSLQVAQTDLRKSAVETVAKVLEVSVETLDNAESFNDFLLTNISTVASSFDNSYAALQKAQEKQLADLQAKSEGDLSAGERVQLEALSLLDEQNRGILEGILPAVGVRVGEALNAYAQKIREVVAGTIGQTQQKIISDIEVNASIVAEALLAGNAEGKNADVREQVRNFVQQNAETLGSFAEAYELLSNAVDKAKNDVQKQAQETFNKVIAEGERTGRGVSDALALTLLGRAQASPVTEAEQKAQEELEARQAEVDAAIDSQREAFLEGIRENNEDITESWERRIQAFLTAFDEEQEIISQLTNINFAVQDRLSSLAALSPEEILGQVLQPDSDQRLQPNTIAARDVETFISSLQKFRTSQETQASAAAERAVFESSIDAERQIFGLERQIEDLEERYGSVANLQSLQEKKLAVQVGEIDREIAFERGRVNRDKRSRRKVQELLIKREQLELEANEAIDDYRRAYEEFVAELALQRRARETQRAEESLSQRAELGDREGALEALFNLQESRQAEFDAQERLIHATVRNAEEREIQLRELQDERNRAEDIAGLFDSLDRKLRDEIEREVRGDPQAEGRRRGLDIPLTLSQESDRLGVEIQGVADRIEQQQLAVDLLKARIAATNDENVRQDLEIQLQDVQQRIEDMELLQAERAAEREVADQGVLGPVLGEGGGLNLDEIIAKIELLNSKTKNLANTVQGLLVSGFDNMLGSISKAIVEGESLGQTFKNVFRQMVKDIQVAIIKALLLKAVMAALNLIPGVGPALSQAAGVAGTAPGSPLGSALGSILGSAGGGGATQPSAAAVNLAGTRATASGTLAATAPRASPAASQADALGAQLSGLREAVLSQPPVQVRNINTVDSDIAHDYFTSPEGERTLFNHISKNPGRVKEELSG